ncbi:hypothetical protein Vadar_027606 [Vaccinium darrowii]|uniref:Uncharacterized protein n=1 Tax=Vaccinium darrowii TaxID=229202 RepID=A0ACB7Y200_9ERIC|nr:hypothetical protein Vadar_027606 [Vaccinium darrowii]
MPHRNSTTRKDQPNTTLTLRRSPRLLTKNLPPAEYPQTPDTQSEKTHKRYQELKSGSKFSGKLETGSRRSATVNGNVCLRRSPRFSGYKSTTTDEKIGSSEVNRKGLLNVGEAEVGINRSKEILPKIEKRVSRHSSRGVDECVKKITEEGLSVVECAKVCGSPSKQFMDRSEKMTKRNSAVEKVKGNGFLRSTCTGIFDEEDFLDVKGAEVGGNSGKKYGIKSENRINRSSAAKSGKRNGFIWSASTGIFDKNECFLDVERDKMGGNSCKRNGGKLEKKAICGSGASVELGGGEGDTPILEEEMFLEYAVEAVYSSQKDSRYLKKRCERSSSAHDKKHMSRLSGLYGATLASPPVLKPVKNKALHEKYIDHLHCREVKRRAAKALHGKENRKETCIDIQKTDAIKAAKDALVLDAKEVIHQFHHVKVRDSCNFPDFEDDFVEGDDYEVEDEP